MTDTYNPDAKFFCTGLQQEITFKECIDNFRKDKDVSCMSCVLGGENLSDFLEHTNSRKKRKPGRPKKSKVKRPAVEHCKTEDLSQHILEGHKEEVYLDFVGHENLFNEVKKLAKDEIRTIEEQIYYAIKKYIKITNTERKMAK